MDFLFKFLIKEGDIDMDDFTTEFSYEEIEDNYYGYEDWYDIQQAILNDLKSKIDNSNT